MGTIEIYITFCQNISVGICCSFPSQFKHLPPAPENCSEWKCVDEEASENPSEIKYFKLAAQNLEPLQI